MVHNKLNGFCLFSKTPQIAYLMELFLSTFLMEFHRPKDKDTVAQSLDNIWFQRCLR